MSAVRARHQVPHNGFVAQLVEQRIENPCVTSSILVRATKRSIQHKFVLLSFKPGIRGVLFCSVLIQRIQNKFSSCGPMHGGLVGLVAELSIQYLRGVS